MKLVSFEMSLLRNHEVHSQSVERFAVIVYGKTHFPFPLSSFLRSLHSDIIEMNIVAKEKGMMMIVVLTGWFGRMKEGKIQ